MKKQADIVIAQYNEPLKWISTLDSNIISKIYIYTKNRQNITEITHPKIPISRVYLPNIGREAHTYLHHIINHYNKLSDFIFFVQGSHATLSVPCINRIYNKFIMNPLVTRTDNFDKSQSFYLGSELKLRRWRGCALKDTGMKFPEWYKKNINNNLPRQPYAIYWEANFGVRKENILSRSKQYYIDLISQLDENNTEVAHFLERSWFYLFNLQNHSM